MNDRPRPPSLIPQGRVRRSALVQLLGATLGEEKSREALAMAAQQLGILDPISFSLEQAEGLLQLLGNEEGIVGVTARFALGRVGSLLTNDDDEPTETGVKVVRPPTSEPSTGSYNRLPTLSLNELVELFAPTLGAAKASEVIRSASGQLGIGAGPWPRPQATRLVDHLAAADGIIGVVARVSQPRVLQKLSK